jgi:opacity protein-like surface antigen
MRRFVLAVLTVLCGASLASAQSGSPSLSLSDSETAHSFADAKDGVRFLALAGGDAIAMPIAPISLSAAPAAPLPPSSFGHYEGYRFQLYEGYSYFRFRSTPFNANLNGLQSSLSYYLNDWFAVEGNTVAAFGTRVLGADRSKSLLFTGGARVAWRDSKRKLEPWMHGLVGGLHIIPQTAAGGKTGFAFQGGGGVDYKLSGRASVRVGGDYVRSQLYSQAQNSFQIGGGLVFNF